jgi:hypothetical protein
MLGKPKNVENISNDLEVDELANFAVTQHNNQTVSLFVSLVFLMHPRSSSLDARVLDGRELGFADSTNTYLCEKNST